MKGLQVAVPAFALQQLQVPVPSGAGAFTAKQAAFSFQQLSPQVPCSA